MNISQYSTANHIKNLLIIIFILPLIINFIWKLNKVYTLGSSPIRTTGSFSLLLKFASSGLNYKIIILINI